MNHKAARARRRSFALALAALAAGVAAFFVPAIANAEAPTAQASYYGLDWVPYIDPSDLPPVTSRPIACIVDTGVAVTPDLPASDVTGLVVGRVATDNSSGEPISTEFPQSHGSSMATYAFGANNGWGITGIFPQGRFLAIRANLNSSSSIDYPSGMKKCRTFAGTNGLTIAAMSLSLGSDGIDNGILFADELQRAANNNYAVVAAAGNTPGPVDSPANTSGVFTAAAGQVNGALCSYAAYGPQVEIVGPSCGIDDVDPFTGVRYASNSGGSSMATAVTTAVVLMLRTLRPTASVDDIEGWITAGATVVDDKPILNGTGAMHAAGLDDVVGRAKAREIATNNPPTESTTPTKAQLRTPRARVSFSRGFLRVRASNRPAHTKLEAVLVYRGGEFGSKSLKRSSKSSRLKIRSHRRPWRVRVRYLKGALTSPTISFRDRRKSTFVQLKSASNK